MNNVNQLKSNHISKRQAVETLSDSSNNSLTSIGQGIFNNQNQRNPAKNKETTNTKGPNSRVTDKMLENSISDETYEEDGELSGIKSHQEKEDVNALKKQLEQEILKSFEQFE